MREATDSVQLKDASSGRTRSLLEGWKRGLMILLLVTAGMLPVSASLEKPLSDSAFVSLLTASPGQEVYSHYGHTAIRVCDPAQGFDLAFNYGLFDFNSPNFIGRFVTGQTDYLCGATSYSDFLLEYQGANRAVTEQVLNLKPAEREAIWQALVLNIQPENRTYRYNFFYNNCATRPRDVIEAHLQGSIRWQWDGPYNTLRDELHHFTQPHPWTQFGIDFVIGAEADQKANLQTQQFAPDVLMESFARAEIQDSGSTRPLVLETRQPISIDPSLDKPAGAFPRPLTVTLILLLISTVVCAYEWAKNKDGHVLTSIVYGLYGLPGSIIAFLMFFSEHPATDVNYLLFWLHPFHLVFAFGMIFAAFREKIAVWYLGINLLLQLSALAGLFLLPQEIHPAAIPLLGILIQRTLMGLRHLRFRVFFPNKTTE